MDNYFLLYLVSQYWFYRCEWWESDEINDADYHARMWGASRAFEATIQEFAKIESCEIFDLWTKFYEDNFNSQGFSDAIIALAR